MRLIHYRFGDFVLDPAGRELTRCGERVALPLKSLECLVYLVANRQRAVGRDELVSAVWGRAEVSDTVITQTLRRARKALDDAGDRQAVIRTVSGFGYRWVAEVEEVDAQATVGVPEPVPAPEPASMPDADADAEVDAEFEEEADADAVADAERVPAPASTPVRSRRWRPGWVAGALALMLTLGLGAAGLWYLQHAARTAEVEAVDNRVAVLPVRVEPVDAELSWVRLGAMEYAAERLRSARLRVTPTDQVLHLDAVLQRSSPNATDPTALRDLRIRSDARWLIVPSARRVGSQWRVQLRSVGRDDDISVEGTGDTALQAMAVATDSWLRRVGRKAPVAAVPTAVQEHLRRIDAELDAGQLDAARTQIKDAPAGLRDTPMLRVREGQLEYRAGHMDAAARLFQAALAQAGPIESGVRAKGLMGLGAVALRDGQPEQAKRHYSEALEAAKTTASTQDVSLLGNAYNGRGVAQVQLGQLDAAVADLGHARIAMQRSGDVVSAAMVGSNLGRLEALRNHWPQALQEFDNAAEVFRRYQVYDYFVATLVSKANAELAVVQPDAAARTVERSEELLQRVEDTQLLAVARTAQVEVALANGQLARARELLRVMPTSGMAGQSLVRLQMADALARGDQAGGAQLAARLPDLAELLQPATLAVAVQAAGSRAAAQRWMTRYEAQQPPQQALQATAAWSVAAVLARFGDSIRALQAADAALTIANRDGSPSERIRANLLRARILIDAGRLDDATAVLGELDAYTAVDYRVAWFAWTLYTRRGEVDLASSAEKQARALAGERALEAVPLL
ncbi:winged helix-turn-helix domain-containing protein [Stenotrophomonas sp. PS02289]|uniref:winged helix-turn-helix domain-containing protein n=1 Tax=Stenotrophomonas sp. PS02289 TaxID=2991422 RepID=UPI00249A71C4|nr:winged helix-turn-helix domain-containing protein [Stenotrophomonas sp. PS02289]